MQFPVIASDGIKPIKCAVVSRPTDAEKHKRAMLRYFVLVIALVAVVFLMTIALYFTQGHFVTIKHVSSLAPHTSSRA